MAEPFDLIDLLRYPGVRITIGHAGYLWLTRVGYMWNVYSCKRRRGVANLIISTADINEAITAFVKEAGIKKEDIQHG